MTTPIDRNSDDDGLARRVRELEQELAATRDHLRTKIEELENANRDLESILNISVAAVVVLDEDLRVTRYSVANHGVFNLLPTSVGKPLTAIEGAVDMTVLSEEIDEALASGTVIERDLTLGGDVFLVRMNPQSKTHGGGLVISFVEITARLAAAREARRLTTMLNDSSDAIMVLAEDGAILSWNHGAERMYGYSESDALESNIRILVPPAQQHEWQAAMERVYSGAPGERMETIRRHQDGRDIEVSVAISALLDESGNIYGLATADRDLTAIRNAEAQRRQAEIAHESRLTTAGEMAAGLAHELNQPITSIVHFCDVALAIAKSFDPKRRDELKDVLIDANAQAERAGEIINNLRRFLGHRESIRSPMDLNEVVKATAKFMEPECIRHDIALQLELADTLPLVSIDETQITQVIVNLIKNSIDAMESTGSDSRAITIATEARDRPVRSVQIIVRDTGPGVTPEIVERLFEPFQTDKPNGLGMGLWISRSLVESHGGRLWCERTSAAGAEFHFSLPVADIGET